MTSENANSNAGAGSGVTGEKIVTWDRLYELVWSERTLKIATRYGV